MLRAACLVMRALGGGWNDGVAGLRREVFFETLGCGAIAGRIASSS